MILFCSAGFAGLAFDIPRACFDLENTESSSPASEILWHWLLRQIRLSEANAAIHNIYKKDCAAVFFDLNSDGEDEVLGTHYSSVKNGNGGWLLYILQKNSKGIYQEITGEEIYFDVRHPVCILLKKTDGYRNFQVFNKNLDDDITYSYRQDKKLNFKKVAIATFIF